MEPPPRLTGPIHVDELPLRSHHRYCLTADGAPEATGAGIPVHLLIGSQRRPLLALMAGVHGDEYDGILALHEIARDLQPSQMQGALVVVPVANPYAFAAAQRRTPQDGNDLNRVFPGGPDGAFSERLAHLLCTALLDHADLVFTLHGSSAQGILSPWVEFLDRSDSLARATYDAARASGFPDLIALPLLPGTLQTAMAERGVPVVEGEVGGLGATRRENVLYYKERVLALARYLGVLPKSANTAPPPQQQIWRLFRMESRVTGSFLQNVELRQMVSAGAPLGRVLDIHGEEIEIVRAPHDGMIGGYRVHAGVRPGDRLFTLWLRRPQAR